LKIFKSLLKQFPLITGTDFLAYFKEFHEEAFDEFCGSGNGTSRSSRNFNVNGTPSPAAPASSNTVCS
jgi:hypothetical protein